MIDVFIAVYLLVAGLSHRQDGPAWRLLIAPVSPLLRWLGLHQYWSMFTPDPATTERHLRVVLKLQSGRAIVWEPPRMGALSRWQAFLWFRHEEYTRALLCDWGAPFRPALRDYLLRKYDFGADPVVDVVFTCTERAIPPPGRR